MSDPRQKTYSRRQRWSWLLLPVGGSLIVSSLIYHQFFSQMDSSAWMGIGIIGTLCILGYVILERENLRTKASQGSAQYTSTALGLSALFLGLVIVINVLGVRYDKRWDLTDNQKYTLSDQSRSILQALSEPVQVTAFFQIGDPVGEDFRLLIENAQAESKLITFELLDPLSEPYKVEQFEITSTYGTVVIQQGDEERRLESSFKEESFINALVQLTSNTKHEICFTIGHGELELNDSSEVGASVFREALEKQNYLAKEINLLREGGIPESCVATVVAGPQYDFQDSELMLLANGVAQGENIFVMIDPGASPNLARDMERYGIIVGDDLVLEQNPKYQVVNGDISYVILDSESLSPHPIFSLRNPMLIMRMVRSVDADTEASGVQVQGLAYTTENSWAEQGYDSSEMPSPDLGKERIGNVPIMVASEVIDASALSLLSMNSQNNVPIETESLANTPEEGAAEEVTDGPADKAPEIKEAAKERTDGSKIIVIGSSSIALNSSFTNSPANLSLLRNVIAWMAGETAQLNQGADDDATAGLQANALQVMLVWIVCVLIAPVFLLIGAINTWWSTRVR
ncbi:MAG: Gldg family protein [Myxococcota bacterium]|nr:Gldg family protein [Myxococcota bacterium]